MMMKEIRRLLGRTSAGVFAAVVFMSSASSAEEESAALPMLLELSVANGPVSEGEPVVLNYKIVNASGKKGFVDLGKGGRKWLTFRLVDATGRSVSALTEQRRLNPRYEGPVPDGTYVSAGTGIQGSIVISRLLPPLGTGSYTLSVQARLPYAIETGIGIPLPLAAKAEESVLTRNETFPLTVVKADARRLQSVAHSLKETIVDGNEMERDVALQALFSMPARYALASQRALVSDRRLDDRAMQSIFNRLAGFDSEAVADFLADAAWTLKKRAARSALSTMHALGDASLKRYIDKIFSDHGEERPRPLVDRG